MTAQETQYLPKPPLDLPTELPVEIPAHLEHHQAHSHPQQHMGVKTLISWSAPGRPFRKRGKEYYISSLLIAVVFEILLFLFGQYTLMLVVASFVFVTFALVTVPPHDFHYRISTEGITIEDHFFLWQEVYDFYFKKREGLEVLHIRTKALIPGELTLTLGSLDQEHIKTVLLPYLPYREVVKQTFMEKSGDWLSHNFPLERSKVAS